MKVIIVLPTYNERENIGPMLHALEQVRAELKHELQVLVVDDNSPDGTQGIVKAAMETSPWIHLMTGQKQGLGAAYIRGMSEAMAMHADVIFEMDCDFSHDPEDIPRLLHEIERGADFVIGSRYVSGGRIPDEWKLWRKANSFFGNIVARMVAGIYPVRDCTAGFRAIRTSMLSQVDFDSIKTQGYGFQVSLLHACYVLGARVREVPVIFTDRAYGESKLGLKDIIEFIQNAFAIRLRGMERFIKFGAVGLSGVVVNLFFFWLFQTWGAEPYLASPLAIEVSIIWNFLLNNLWTFSESKGDSRFIVRGLKFNVVSLMSLLVSYGTFLSLNAMFPDGNQYLYQASGIIPASVFNYFCNLYWTFGKKKAGTDDHDASLVLGKEVQE
ncbi:glycosyltransferase [Pseudobacteriovorax antillogorgiicola]|uniref:Dolichol-phosphate mannosyltransferase n=1 Tax=Pseudobacteriovorax antillogorgiicola TaxID=1513793 RepID=A0A1Y6BIW4_9BACT|nr:glycosyltransferase family 2 protein [Pseudobacteriovorax antillogorgiicola]TCS55485.1 dolichol-phosphate mannosyltransferase [Pseudobacteriovorax antillogorgiicola]SMF11868.1 dolichol-phosphate mannosyltransferase [Pseudobacteriovorax antillogorgiicola]